MKHYVMIAALALAVSAPLAAQTPSGWKMRVDRSTAAEDPAASTGIKFVTQGSGFHATNTQAATFWNPANTAKGAYTLKATFTPVKEAPGEYVGLMFGGSALEGAQQSYVYFLIAPNGTFQIKNRAGEVASTVTPRTPSAAVNKPDASGKSTNAMEVRVGADKIDFVVNGTIVHSAPKTGALAKTDGIYGIRVNHGIEVQVDGFGISK